MAFKEDVLPVDVRPGSMSTPAFSTTVKQLRGGGEYRSRNWAHPLRNFEIAYGSRTKERIEAELQTFMFDVAVGSFNGFRARDWSDYTATNEQLGVGDGTTYWFRFYKRYANYQRRIMKPDPSTVTIYVNGGVVDPDTWAIDADNGVVVFLNAPATNDIISWTGEFHVPVRFMEDTLPVNMLLHTRGVIEQIGLRELRIKEVIDTDEYDTIRDYLATFDKTDLDNMLDLLHIHVNTKWPESDTSP